jgi:hypothetical protein
MSTTYEQLQAIGKSAADSIAALTLLAGAPIVMRGRK